MTTGDVRNASTSANVFIVLYGGEDGEKNSGKLVLRNENNDNFKRDRTDIFQYMFGYLDMFEVISKDHVNFIPIFLNCVLSG